MIALDDNIEDHPKFVSLSDDSFSLWVRCIGYCRRNLTDGFVPAQAAKSRCRGERTPEDIIGELLAAPVGLPDSAPLWAAVPGGYQIHDYLDRWNPSKADVEASRQQKRVAGSRGGKRSGELRGEANVQAEPKQTRSRTQAECLPSACPSASPPAKPDPIRSDPKEEIKDPVGSSEPVGSAPTSPTIMGVWVAYLNGRKRNGSKGVEPILNDKRKRLIKARIKEHGVEVAEAAARGIWLSDWNVREGQTSIDLAMRDAAHVEKFAALGGASQRQPALFDADATPRNQPPAPRPAALVPTSLEELRAGVEEMRARGVEPHPAMLTHIRKLEAESA